MSKSMKQLLHKDVKEHETQTLLATVFMWGVIKGVDIHGFM